MIPMHQPDGRLVRALLNTAPWNHIAFPPLAGAVVPASRGPVRSATAPRGCHAPLEPGQPSLPNPAYRRRPAGRRPAAVVLRNDVEGIAAVNRLIDHGVEVLRGPSGAFAVLEGPRAELEALAASASCADTLTSAPEFQRRVAAASHRRLRRPGGGSAPSRARRQRAVRAGPDGVSVHLHRGRRCAGWDPQRRSTPDRSGRVGARDRRRLGGSSAAVAASRTARRPRPGRRERDPEVRRRRRALSRHRLRRGPSRVARICGTGRRRRGRRAARRGPRR